jgi:AraC family L-rhamnose operon transcriptional activator RhaR/AraC family L-rhamnose operon regulatory protein RhaS
MLKHDWNITVHLEKLNLGCKYIPEGKHGEMNLHDHAFSELVVIKNSTSSKHWVHNKSINISRGDVLLLHPGVVHGYENVDNLSLFNVLFEPEKLPLPLLDGGSMPLFKEIMYSKNKSSRNFREILVHLPEDTMTKVEVILFDLQEELSGKEVGKELRALALFINLITLIYRIMSHIPCRPNIVTATTHSIPSCT